MYYLFHSELNGVVISVKLAEEAVLHVPSSTETWKSQASTVRNAAHILDWGLWTLALKGVEQNLLAENCVCLSSLPGTREGLTQDTCLSFI